MVPDFSGATGRVNHIAYRVDQRLDVERAAEVFTANDTPIEFGPGIHGIDEITYLYVREPGGMRMEINSGGWENYLPDWEVRDWHPSQGGTTIWKNVVMPESMMDALVNDRAGQHARVAHRPNPRLRTLRLRSVGRAGLPDDSSSTCSCPRKRGATVGRTLV